MIARTANMAATAVTRDDDGDLEKKKKEEKDAR